MARGNAMWDLIEDPKVNEVAENVAAKLAAENEGILDADDLKQEALVLVATIPHLMSVATDKNYGLLHSRVRTEILHKFIEPLNRSGQLHAMKYRVPLEEEYEVIEPITMFTEGTGDYTLDAIKLLLPAVWDESYYYGLPQRDDAPEKDMPKGSTNKATGGNLFAYIADIKTGWESTPLTRNERAALLLYFGMGWTHEQIAFNQMVSRQLITTRIDTACKKIAARLNGGGWLLTETTT